MKNTVAYLFILLSCLFTALQCTPRTAGPVAVNRPPAKRGVERPKNEPMDTVRWTDRNNGRPPIGKQTETPRPEPRSGSTYTIGILLPFLTRDFTAAGETEAPEKSKLALQFYTGAKIALEQLSTESSMNLVVDVYDTEVSDADFQSLFRNSRFDKADLYIGPIRPSHVSLLAERAKAGRKIVVSPESPNMDLTSRNPDFIQINPSLRAHCAGIARFVLKRNRPEAVTLVCRQREADRLPFFQQTNTLSGNNTAFNELIVSDETTSFERIDLRNFIQPGRNNVFIMPSWSNQDFIVAFLRKLKAVKGNNRVEVYGMPQWRNFEGIDAEFLLPLNVHISSAAFIDYEMQNVRDFQQKFYDLSGTLPDEDGFNGYDVMLLTGRMLQRYGLSFPERLPREFADGLRTRFHFNRVGTTGPLDAASPNYDYIENTFVHILRFDAYGFRPAVQE